MQYIIKNTIRIEKSVKQKDQSQVKKSILTPLR